MSDFIQKLFTSYKERTDGDTRIGERNRIWYDSINNVFRIQLDNTPGGTIIGGGGTGGSDYTLPTASTTVKGGVKIDGTTITINNQVISATQQDLSSYATQSYVTSRGYISSYTETDPVFTAWDKSTGISITESQISDLQNYLTTETDPVFTASDAAGITSTDITNWGSAYSWGNHADAGYLTSTAQIVWVNPSPTPQTLWRNSVTANSTGATISLITGLPGLGSEVTWTFDEDKIKFPDNTEQTTAFTGSIAYASVTGTPTLATVATSGSYTDLISKPTIPAAQIQSDWNQATNTALDYIKNKPTIPTTVTVNGTSITLGSSGTVTAAAGTLTGTTLNSTVVSSSLTSVGTLTGVTSNAATAFIAGTAAESGVALQMPREGALRNLYNGTGNNMYFDVSIGGASNGQFQFRSSSAFTNVLTMSPTAFNVNLDATVTARSPSLGRLAWNSVIETELTIDDYRFRVSNSGGIFPQIISNVSGQTKNSAWTSVAAISGDAIKQVGSTGNLVPNNSWVTLCNTHGMDNPGDTVTVTLQDKNLGRIYRITFMRGDNGVLTGYNIIAERLL